MDKRETHIGSRLAEERLRLGLTRQQMADDVGSMLNSQARYERGERFPDANYLAAAAALGVDARYVLTGRRYLSADQASATLELAASIKTPENAADFRSRVIEIAHDTSLPDRLRAQADLFLRLNFDDPDAEARNQERLGRARVEQRRAEVLVDDACSSIGWLPPASLRGHLVNLVRFYGVDMETVTAMVYDIKQVLS